MKKLILLLFIFISFTGFAQKDLGTYIRTDSMKIKLVKMIEQTVLLQNSGNLQFKGDSIWFYNGHEWFNLTSFVEYPELDPVFTADSANFVRLIDTIILVATPKQINDSINAHNDWLRIEGENIFHNGNVRMGGSTAPTVACDVTGAIKASSTISAITSVGAGSYILHATATSGLYYSNTGRCKIIIGTITDGGAYPWNYHSGGSTYTGGSHNFYINNVLAFNVDSNYNAGIGMNINNANLTRLHINKNSSITTFATAGHLDITNVNATANNWTAIRFGKDSTSLATASGLGFNWADANYSYYSLWTTKAGTPTEVLREYPDSGSRFSLLNMNNKKIINLASGTAGTDGANFQQLLDSNQWSRSSNNICNKNSGNVGIGTAGASSFLHAKKDQNAETAIKVENINGSGTSSTARFWALSDTASVFILSHGTGVTGTRQGVTLANYSEIVTSAGKGLLIGTNSTVPVLIGTNSTNAIYIDGSQRVGIGTEIPSEKLEVNGNVLVEDNLTVNDTVKTDKIYSSNFTNKHIIFANSSKCLSSSSNFRLENSRLLLTDDYGNTIIGLNVGTPTGINNVLYGAGTGKSLSTGARNVITGTYAGYTLASGNGNIFIGDHAGYTSIGSKNILLGDSAGYNETGSNKLYIENTNADSTDALIFGNFDINKVTINDSLHTQSIFAEGNISALTFTDRTPYPKDLKIAYNAVNSMKLNSKSKNFKKGFGEIDHKSLDKSIQSQDGKGRDISATISAQNAVIQDLIKRIESLEKSNKELQKALNKKPGI